MRAVGIGALGMIGGVLLAIVLQDVLASALTSDDGTPSALGMSLGAILPAFGLTGAGLAIWLHRRKQRGSLRRHRRRRAPQLALPNDGQPPRRGSGADERTTG